MFPTALISALALHLGVQRVVLLSLGQHGTTDSDLALLHSVSLEYQLGVNILNNASFDETVEDSLVIDQNGESQNLKDRRFFYSNVYWMSKVSNVNEVPDMLRFDSSFFVPTLSSNGTWVTYDFYKIGTNMGGGGRRTYSDYVGIWNSDDGINIPIGVWDRRHLHGLPIRVTTVPNTRFAWDYNNDGSFSGLIVDVVERMGTMSNFTMDWIIPPDGAYGSKNPDGTWNGMIGLLTKDVADIAGAMLSITLSRSEVVSYTHPFLETKSTLLGTEETFKNSGGAFNFTGYLSVLTIEAWICFLVLLSVDVLAFLIYFNASKVSINYSDSLGKSFVAVGETVVKLGLSFDPKVIKISAKILFWTAAMFPVVFMSHYEGLLTSYLTVKKPPPELKSVADILSTGHEIILVKDSRQEDEFKYSPKGSPRKRVYEALIEGNNDVLIETPSKMKAILAVEAGTVGAGSMIKGDILLPERLYGLMGLDEAIPDPLAFALQKDSEFLGLVNHNMIRLYHSGVLEFIKSQWLTLRKPHAVGRENTADQNARYQLIKKGQLTFYSLSFENSPLGYDNLLLPTLVLVGGGIVALVLLMLEGFLQNTFKVIVL